MLHTVPGIRFCARKTLKTKCGNAGVTKPAQLSWTCESRISFGLMHDQNQDTVSNDNGFCALKTEKQTENCKDFLCILEYLAHPGAGSATGDQARAVRSKSVNQGRTHSCRCAIRKIGAFQKNCSLSHRQCRMMRIDRPILNLQLPGSLRQNLRLDGSAVESVAEKILRSNDVSKSGASVVLKITI